MRGRFSKKKGSESLIFSKEEVPKIKSYSHSLKLPENFLEKMSDNQLELGISPKPRSGNLFGVF